MALLQGSKDISSLSPTKPSAGTLAETGIEPFLILAERGHGGNGHLQFWRKRVMP